MINHNLTPMLYLFRLRSIDTLMRDRLRRIFSKSCKMYIITDEFLYVSLLESISPLSFAEIKRSCEKILKNYYPLKISEISRVMK